MAMTHFFKSPLIQYLNYGQFLRFYQTNHHVVKHIHDQLKFHLDYLGYQLKHTHNPLQSVNV